MWQHQEARSRASSHLVDAEEAERHNVAAPGGAAVAAAGAGGNATPVKDNGHVVVALALAALVEGLWSVHRRAEVKACTDTSHLLHFRLFQSFFFLGCKYQEKKPKNKRGQF